MEVPEYISLRALAHSQAEENRMQQEFQSMLEMYAIEGFKVFNNLSSTPKRWRS